MALASNLIKKDNVMFSLWDYTRIHKKESSTEHECYTCQEDTVFIYSARIWFTILDTPIYPINSSEYYFGCSSCKENNRVGMAVNLAELMSDENNSSDTEQDED